MVRSGTDEGQLFGFWIAGSGGQNGLHLADFTALFYSKLVLNTPVKDCQKQDYFLGIFHCFVSFAKCFLEHSLWIPHCNTAYFVLCSAAEVVQADGWKQSLLFWALNALWNVKKDWSLLWPFSQAWWAVHRPFCWIIKGRVGSMGFMLTENFSVRCRLFEAVSQTSSLF